MKLKTTEFIRKTTKFLEIRASKTAIDNHFAGADLQAWTLAFSFDAANKTLRRAGK